MFDINAYFAEIKERAAALTPYSDGAIYLVSLDNRQRGTKAGQMAVLNNKTVAATHIVDGCYRVALPSEIEDWKKGQIEKAQRERDELAARQIKTNLVINVPGLNAGGPVQVEVPASALNPSGKRQSTSVNA